MTVIMKIQQILLWFFYSWWDEIKSLTFLFSIMVGVNIYVIIRPIPYYQVIWSNLALLVGYFLAGYLYRILLVLIEGRMKFFFMAFAPLGLLYAVLFVIANQRQYSARDIVPLITLIVGVEVLSALITFVRSNLAIRRIR